MKYWLYIVLIICVSCSENSTRRSENGAVPIGVRTITIQKSTDMRTRSYVGQAKASKSVTMFAPYPGTLQMLDVGVGEHISEGDVLAELYSESVRSAYDMSLATLKQAEDGFSRATKVYEKGGVAAVKYKEVETDLTKARASASAAEDVFYSGRITAPFDGVVSAVYAHQGEDVAIDAPLIRLLDPNSIEISFSIPEGELSDIYEGMLAKIDIPALDMEGVPAEVKTKGVEASPVSHTYECSLRLRKQVEGLAPGMVCKVVLGKDMQPNHIVPAPLVQTDRYGRYVWVIEDEAVRKAYVAIGGFSGNGVIVTDGLSDGDQVISEGYRKVSSGMRVNVLSDRK